MEKALVFGAGLSGLGAKELLEKKGYEVYLIDDKVAKTSKEGIEILNNEKIEFIVKSPGIPWKAELLQVAKEKNVQVISEIDLAYKYMDKNIKVFSITGTNGKTTTATKIYELLDFAGYKARLAGNAGFSFAKLVADEEPLEYVVLELSSYQLENNPQIHSNIAGIINLTPDHLTRYKTVDDPVFLGLAEREEIKALMKAKNVYLSKEKKGNIFVYNNEIRIMNDLADRAENLSGIEILEKSRFLIKVGDLALKGVHNLENMLFLIGVAAIVKVPDEKVVKFLSSTKALEHRLENFFVKGNTTFINDSKGTNVESTLKAIDSFNNDIIMILGGDDKKIDNTELVKRIAEKVERVYLIGDNAPLLINDMEKINYKNYKNLETLENVLNYIKENEDFEKDQTILFSPATSSFCQFKSFEHRGKVFKELTVKILGN